MSGPQNFILRAQNDPTLTLRFRLEPDGRVLLEDQPAQAVRILRREPSGLLTVLWGERVLNAIVVAGGERGCQLEISIAGETHALRLRDANLDAMEQALAGSQQGASSLDVRSPIPGLVKAVRVEAGATVSAGQTLVVLEAMKMENEITAPHAGVVQSVEVKPGQAVPAGALLVKIQT